MKDNRRVMVNTKKVITACALLACSIAFLAFIWNGSESPPCLLPPGNYNEENISSTKAALLRLLPVYWAEIEQYPGRGLRPNLIYANTDTKYRKMVDDIVGKNPSPEDLAMLAIWAEQKDPWLDSDNHIYGIVFGRSIGRLSEMKGLRAEYALWKIRQTLVIKVHFDGHIAESIVEAQQDQRSHSK